MENEELLANEATSVQQNSRRMGYRSTLQVHNEPLLANDDRDNEWPEDEQVKETDNQPRWRRPTVSAFEVPSATKISRISPSIHLIEF
jgi:hypothetical protein